INGRKRELAVVGVALSPEYIYTLGAGMIAPDDRRFGIFWTGRQVLEAALGPYGAADVHGRKRQPSHAFVPAMLHQIAGVGRIVPAIFLLVAAFLAHTMLGRLVEVQRRQIGLMKALG